MNIGLDARFVADHYPGVGRYAYSLYLALVRRYSHTQFTIIIGTAHNSRFDLTRLTSQPNVRQVRTAITPLSPLNGWLLAGIRRKTHIELLHTPHVSLQVDAGILNITTLHDLIPWLVPASMPSSLKRRVYLELSRHASRKAAAIVTGSNRASEDLQRVLRIPAQKVHVIYHGVDEVFRPMTRSAVNDVLHLYHLDKPYLLFCGANKPHKNMERLVQAWAALPAAIRDANRLVLLGASDDRYPTASQLTARYGVGSSVVSLGPCPEEHMPAIYNGALGLVMPSLSEGFGLPVLEAMACAAPVACSAGTALEEVVGDAGLLFNPLDVSSISQAVERLLTDSALRGRLRCAGLLRAQKFTWDAAAESTMALYQSVLHT